MRLAARSLPVLLFLYSYGDQRALPSFPTRRSSDLPSSVPPSGGLSSRGPARGGLASGSAAGGREGRVRGGGVVVREMPLGLVHYTRCPPPGGCGIRGARLDYYSLPLYVETVL